MKSESNYIQKKETLTESIKQLSETILTNHDTLDEIKKTITKDGFFSDEISNIITQEQQI
jgi:penicillin V acylase-like amidase (Ntn superfamily)